MFLLHLSDVDESRYSSSSPRRSYKTQSHDPPVPRASYTVRNGVGQYRISSFLWGPLMPWPNDKDDVAAPYAGAELA
jgi:hypothetical protein